MAPLSLVLTLGWAFAPAIAAADSGMKPGPEGAAARVGVKVGASTDQMQGAVAHSPLFQLG